MASVTIEGSLSPAAFLARGERRTVQRTDRIDKLIRRGFVVVVDEEGEVEAPPAPEPVKAPAKSASRDDWAEFLAEHTDIVTEGLNRDALQAEYDTWLETHDQPAADE